MENIENIQPEQKGNFGKITAIIVVLILAGFGIWFYKDFKKTPPAEEIISQNSGQIEVTLKINTGQNSYQYKEKTQKGASVLDLMKSASGKEGFVLEIKESSIGAYIDGIAGVKGDISANKFWTFYINGNLSQVGVSDAKLADGDIIEWRYGSM